MSVDDKSREDLMQFLQEVFDWDRLKASEFVSHVILASENNQYYREHPDEKQVMLDKARELLEDWKEAKEEHARIKQQASQGPLTNEMLAEQGVLFDRATKKYRMFLMLVSSCPVEEMRPLLLEAQGQLANKA